MAEGALASDGLGRPLTLAHASGIGAYAFRDTVAGQGAGGIQLDKGQNMDGVADLCGIFHEHVLLKC